jgi:hypothetical protein
MLQYPDVSYAPASSRGDLELASRVFKERMDERADIERDLGMRVCNWTFLCRWSGVQPIIE